MREAQCETGWGEATMAAQRMNIHPTPTRVSRVSTLPLQGRVTPLELTVRLRAGSHRSMIQRRLLILALTLVATPASAMVGGGGAPSEPVARAVVTIIGSRGTFCTGSLIAQDLVLTAAHCVMPGADYKVIIPGETQPQLLEVRRVAQHPQFNVASILAHRASADVALLQLTAPLPASKAPAPLGMPVIPIAAGARLTVAGVGVTKRGDGKSGGTIRAADLTVTGKPGTLQIRLSDPLTNNAREGLGACTGDSGAPVFEMQAGRAVIVGVVSWSTGPNNTDGCGGLTGVTPLTLYREWILRTARAWGVNL
jgi:secreted trypsin-like serine protease